MLLFRGRGNARRTLQVHRCRRWCWWLWPFADDARIANFTDNEAGDALLSETMGGLERVAVDFCECGGFDNN